LSNLFDPEYYKQNEHPEMLLPVGALSYSVLLFRARIVNALGTAEKYFGSQ
jgi:hypothetical protein